MDTLNSQVSQLVSSQQANNSLSQISSEINSLATLRQKVETTKDLLNANSLSIYSAISKEEYDKNIKDLTPSDAIYYLENKYLEIEFLFGTNIGIREKDIYAIEYIVIEKENGDKLRDFGKMILKLFPTSPLGEYYIGRYYESGKMIKKALKYYKIGYGKMDPSDPNADAFYENILRLGGQ